MLLTSACRAESLSLDSIPGLVLSGHPSLKAARLIINEAVARQNASGRLSNPRAGMEWRNETAVEPGSATFSIDQMIPLTRRLRLEKQLTAAQVAAAELEVKNLERQLIAEASSFAVQLLSSQQQLKLRREQAKLAAELAEFVGKRAAAGELSTLDANQTRVDARRMELEISTLEIQHLQIGQSLKPLLGLPPSGPVVVTGKLGPPQDLPPAPAETQRPDYLLAQNKASAAAMEITLARHRKWQDMDAGFFAGSESYSGQRVGFVGLRLSLPLPFRNNNQGEIAEKAASAERARLEADAMITVISHETAAARQEMQAQATLLSDTRGSLLPLAVEQAASLEKAYAVGQTDLVSLLRSREQLLAIESAILSATRDYHLARIRYEAAIAIHTPNPQAP